MYKKIISSFAVKSYGAAVSFIILVITSKILGTEGRGDISLFIANLAFIQIFNEIVNGSSMIYLVPRSNTKNLIVISLIWAALTGFVISLLMYFLNISSKDYFLHLYILSILFSLFTCTSKILLGKEKIQQSNVINAIQISGLIISIFSYYLLMKNSEVIYYIYSMYISYTIASIIGLNFILNLKSKPITESIQSTFITTLKIGAVAQVSNFMDFLTYRIYFYFILFFHAYDKSMLGIFSTGIMVAESVWLISSSIASFQYPSIANKQDIKYATELTTKLSIVSFYASISLLAILIITPTEIYELLFSKDFHEIKRVILYAAPGIISIALSKIYWNYFSGLGLFKINNYSGVIGLISAIVTGIIFIPTSGIIGTTIAYSISCTLAGIYHFYAFYKSSNATLKKVSPLNFPLLVQKNKE